MEKNCELCSKTARMYCDSDEAWLCWDCDERVHSANFLVAKHSRSLLCHVCQSQTPWKASGTKLGPTFSACEACFDASDYSQNPATSRRRRSPLPAEEGEEDDGDHGESIGDGESESAAGSSDDEEEEYSGDEEEDDDETEEEEDGENQVVPWAASCPSPPSATSAPPPLTASTSSSTQHGSYSTRDGGAAAISSAPLKRFREGRMPDSDDEDVYCSSQVNSSMVAAVENTEAARLFRSGEEEETGTCGLVDRFSEKNGIGDYEKDAQSQAKKCLLSGYFKEYYYYP